MSKCIFANHSVEILIEIDNFSLDHDLLHFTIGTSSRQRMLEQRSTNGRCIWANLLYIALVLSMNLMDSEKILRVTFKWCLDQRKILWVTCIRTLFQGHILELEKLPESTKWTPLLFETTAIKQISWETLPKYYSMKK